MKPKHSAIRHFRSLIFAGSAAVTLASPSAHADTITWNSASATTSWADGSNWIGGVAPANSTSTDIALFNSSSYTSQPNAGTTSINGIRIGSSSGALTLAGTSLTLGSGGIVMSAGAAASTISSPIVLGAAQTWDNSSANRLTFSGAVTGAQTLTKTGTGTIQFNSSLAGPLIVNAGTVNANMGIGLALGSSITINDGGAVVVVRISAMDGPTSSIRINSGGLLKIADGLTTQLRPPVTLDGGTLSTGTLGGFGAAHGNWTLQGSISTAGSGNVSTISGLGAAALSKVGGVNFNVLAGDTLNVSLNLIKSTNQPDNGLIKQGLGLMTLSGTNTYTGATSVTAGTLSLGHATDTLSSSSAVSVDGATAVLAIAGNSDTVGAVSLKNGGSITGSGGTLTGASYAVESGSVSAKLGGAGIALTKSTAGTVTLSGVNSYTGATLITGGTLALGASGTIDNTSEVSLGTVGTFDVSAKSGYAVGTLKGSGNVTGALTVSTTLAIGNSPGTINFSSNLTLDALSTYEYELIGGASPSLGSADLGDIAGNLNISAGSILDLVQLGAYTANNKFTLFAYDGTLTGTFDGLADGATFTDAGGIWTIDYNDTSAGANGGVSASNTYVTITAIPEPNAAALLGGLGVLALLRRRR